MARILVVDDNKLAAKVIKDRLASKGAAPSRSMGCSGVTQFAGRVGPQGRIETKNCTVWQPNLVSIRPSAYSTDGLAANRVAPAVVNRVTKWDISFWEVWPS